VRNRPLQLLGHAPRCRLGQATAPRAPLLLPLFARVVAHCQPPTLAICSFSQGNRCRVGEVWPAIFGLLANVHAQEVVAQSGLAARCGCSCWITNPQENNRGSGIKKKPLGQRGVSERSPRLYKTAFGFTERIQTSVKTRLFKIAHFLSQLFTPHHRRAAINFRLGVLRPPDNICDFMSMYLSNSGQTTVINIAQKFI